MSADAQCCHACGQSLHADDRRTFVVIGRTDDDERWPTLIGPVPRKSLAGLDVVVRLHGHTRRRPLHLAMLAALLLELAHDRPRSIRITGSARPLREQVAMILAAAMPDVDPDSAQCVTFDDGPATGHAALADRLYAHLRRCPPRSTEPGGFGG